MPLYLTESACCKGDSNLPPQPSVALSFPKSLDEITVNASLRLPGHACRRSQRADLGGPDFFLLFMNAFRPVAVRRSTDSLTPGESFSAFEHRLK